MGEVYRAHDVKLRRDVALKILPAAFAVDPERLARFKREARVLASLNHPHIAANGEHQQQRRAVTLVDNAYRHAAFLERHELNGSIFAFCSPKRVEVAAV
jgi:serine/threonine protein kinase